MFHESDVDALHRTVPGCLTTRSDLPDSVFAFPKLRKEPLTYANHVRDALARFDQVEGVSDADRDLAFANIKKAAEHYGIEVHEKEWRELGKEVEPRQRSDYQPQLWRFGWPSPLMRNAKKSYRLARLLKGDASLS